MKKILAMALALMMVLALAACGGNEENPSGSGTTDPGTSQQAGNDSKSVATSKADGGQMDADSDNAASYAEVIELSKLDGIGKPVGYSVESPLDADGDTKMRGLTFRPDSGSTADADLDGYAKAIWNLCIEASDDGMLYIYERENLVGFTTIATIDEAKAEWGTYTWYYYIDGTRVETKLSFEDGALIIQFSCGKLYG